MSNAPKLKDHLLANIPKVVTMKTRGKSYPALDFQTKQPKLNQDGTPQQSYMYFFINEEGEYVHFANEIEEQTLSAFNPNDQLQVLKLEQKRAGKPSYFILQWSAIGSAEGNIKPEVTPTQTKHVQNHAKDSHAKDIQICLQGFMQAHIIAGKTNQEAIAQALQARDLLKQAVIDSLSTQ